MKKGRPKVYFGTQIRVKLPAPLDIKLRSESAKTGKPIAELVRETLAERWGREPQNMEEEKLKSSDIWRNQLAYGILLTLSGIQKLLPHPNEVGQRAWKQVAEEAKMELHRVFGPWK